MRARLLALAATALAACSPPRPPAPPVELTLGPGEAPPAPPTPDPAAPPLAPAAATALTPPATVGCEIRTQRVLAPFEPALPLCLAPEGPCFAGSAAVEGPVKITLTYGEGDARRGGAMVTVDDGRLLVRGLAPTRSLRLAPRLLFTMGSPSASGDLAVAFSRVLVVESAARGAAAVSLDLGPGVDVPGGLRTERRCDELQAGSGGFQDEDVRRFVAGKAAPAPPKGGATALRAGVDTPLSTGPGLPPVATLRPDDEAARGVDVLERRGQHARIFWRREGYALFGWIPAAALAAPGKGASNLWGSFDAPPAASTPGRPVTCHEDVPLLVEIAGRRVEVGTVRRGRAFVPGAKRDGLVGVDLGAAPAALEAAAAWLVREADLARACAP